MRASIQDLLAGKRLLRFQAKYAMSQLLDSQVPPTLSAAFLTSLQVKPLQAQELRSFVEVLRERMIPFVHPCIDAIDVCGTGGDGRSTFNVSTISSLLLAASGVTVIKHGNRGVSSQCGSMDFLEALGLNVNAGHEEQVAQLKKHNICFLFAPNYHPSLKKLASLRKELGIPTVFNVLGPLLNPGMVRRQVIGVARKDLLLPVCRAYRELGGLAAVVVHGNEGMDEVSIHANTSVAELLETGEIRRYELSPKDFLVPKYEKRKLIGGNVESNLRVFRSIVAGEESQELDVVLVNAAVALRLSKRFKYLPAACSHLREIVDRGIFRTFLLNMGIDARNLAGLRS